MTALARKHYAVIGRIPFDDEDSIYCCKAATESEAIAHFLIKIVEDSEFTTMAELKKRHGNAPFINAVLISNSPITIRNGGGA